MTCSCHTLFFAVVTFVACPVAIVSYYAVDQTFTACCLLPLLSSPLTAAVRILSCHYLPLLLGTATTPSYKPGSWDDWILELESPLSIFTGDSLSAPLRCTDGRLIPVR